MTKKPGKGRTGSKRAATTRARKPTIKPEATADNHEAARLRHALETHQVELELQNEELRGAREVAEIAHEKFREIFEFAPMGYVVLDTKFQIRDANLVAERLLGNVKSKLIDIPFARFIAARWLSTFNQALLRIGTTGACSLDLELVRKNKAVPVRITAAVLMRRVPSILVAFEDISERRDRELELAKVTEALRVSNQRKDDFIAMLSHELRNPLASIRTTVEAMANLPDGDTATRARSLAILDRATSHLTHLVDDLLDLTRITHGKVTITRRPLELTALLRSLLEEHAPILSAKNLKVETQLASDGAWVDGDRERLAQVFHNILANAEKFTPAHGRIVITAQAIAGYVTVQIADTGVGIAPSTLSRVFEPFEQGPQGLDRSFGGLGLGLATVKALVELHDGTVSIESDGVGRGTRVTVTLHSIDAPVTDVQTAAVMDRGASIRILVVEDQDDVAESLKLALSVLGHEVATVGDGRAAIMMAHAFRPEVVLCDLGLPDMDGYALARHFRDDTALREIHMIALSGYARPEDVAKSLNAGFERHLAKPPRLSELSELLSAARPAH